MKKFSWLLVHAILISQARASENEVKVVYGQDGRKDVYQTNNSLHKALAASTAGMISAGALDVQSTPGFGQIRKEALGTLARFENVCSTEAFSKQFLAPACTGFLVGPDTLVTAGHCYNIKVTPQEACERNYWVFGYEMTSARSNPTKNIPFSNIYTCKQVLGSVFNAQADFTVIKLDRPVVGRQPLPFRKSGKVSDQVELVVIGHPSGLPTKITTGGKITDNSSPTTFLTNLDTFHGNSGSPVFDARTGQIEGILTQGKTDYVPSNPADENSCVVVNKCDDNAKNCLFESESDPKGETVYRITNIAGPLVKVLSP